MMACTFDDIIESRIHFGLWHLLFLISTLPIAFIQFEYFPQLGFIAPNHHCHQPFLSNLSWAHIDILNFSIPQKSRIEDAPMPGQRFHPCKEYNLDSLQHLLTANTSIEEALDMRDELGNLTTRSCANGISFDLATRKVPFSIAEEMELVCDRKYLIQVSNIVYVSGMLIGNLMGGVVADRFGRRKVFFASSLGVIIFAISTPFVTVVWNFIVLRCLTAICRGINLLTIVVQFSEWETSKQRNVMAALLKIYVSLVARGWLVLTVYLTNSWRRSYLLYLSGAVSMILGYFVCFESPRWLVSRGKIDEAVKAMMQVMRLNNFPKLMKEDEEEILKEEIQATMLDNTSDSCNAMNMFRGKILRLLLLMFGFFMLNTHIYFGLNLSIVRPTTNVYLVAFLSGFVGLPSCVLQYISFHYFDRKSPIIVFFVLTSVSLLLGIIFLLAGYNRSVFTVLLALALLYSDATFTMLYVWTPELFPTKVRSTALGFCSAGGRFGMMIGAGIERLDESVWVGLPTTCFFCVSLCCLVLSIFLPPGDSEMKESQRITE